VYLNVLTKCQPVMQQGHNAAQVHRTDIGSRGLMATDTDESLSDARLKFENINES
jgi:hypothetical protein